MGYRSNKRIEDLFDDKPLRRMQRRVIERTAEFARERAEFHSPVADVPEGVSAPEFVRSRGGRRPGTLKKSWRVGEVVVTQGGARMTMEVYSIDPLAELVEFPTQPHLIVPKNADGVLAFPMNGRIVFAKIVRHPGTRGAFMLTTALREADAELERIAREELDLWARGVYD